MTGPRSTARRGMIAPGPRTEARREHAAAMRAAWESMTPETREILAQFPRADRQRITRAIVEGKRVAPIAVGEP